MADAAQYAAQDQEYKAYQEVSNQAEELILRCKNALTVCGKDMDKGERKPDSERPGQPGARV